MCRHKEENKNQHNLTILITDLRQHSMILYIVYFQNFYTNHVRLEHHGRKVTKNTDIGFEVSGAWVLILVLLLPVVIDHQ